ncbi:hypothetical protein CDD82_4999 [Ophiocordyceps australis]|uniref:Nuclear pore complex protein Nup85 n=1 Tax=Ophiocordyceps australis TaxID=1399860 RepID=A0A2C5ZSE6_9HYPO|nr:hypothetical protein CDD82_4999 [Ophiocordyceps australis]
MAQRFVIESSPPSSPEPATPEKKKTQQDADFSFGNQSTSTTPAGPPPRSSMASFASSPSTKESSKSQFKSLASGPAARVGSSNLFGSVDQSRSSYSRLTRGRGMQPSRLSNQLSFDDEPIDQRSEVQYEEDIAHLRSNLFRPSVAQSSNRNDSDDDTELEVERFINDDLEVEAENQDDSESEEASQAESEDMDLFLNMRHDDRPYGKAPIGEESEDLLMFKTPSATHRILEEAEDIFYRSTARLGVLTRSQGFQFATFARNIYAEQEPARVTESSELILQTENLVYRLYEEGIGVEDDAERLDSSLGKVSKLVQLWNDHVNCLPQPEGEDFASIGPSSRAEPFEKASFIANLVLRMHHTRIYSDPGNPKAPPLPEVLLDWIQVNHNLDPNQIKDVSRHKPSPACHVTFWQTLRCALLRGKVSDVVQLLRDACWENVRVGSQGGEAYSGQALENIRRFVGAACDVLEQCPGTRKDWDIWNSGWTLFRVQARGALDKLTIFAEGEASSSIGRKSQSMSTMARKASSQIPWDVYENLQSIYGIVLGKQSAILDTAQDWVEATIGLFTWLDDDSSRQRHGLSQSLGFGSSSSFSQSTDYLDRLASVFHRVLASNLTPNVMHPVEVAIASAFEGNVEAVIGCLRTWSLPVAASVAEIAALGHWLPKPQPAKPLPTDTLSMEDLELLGVMPPTVDEVEGIKDTTLIVYARELAGIEYLRADKYGWELAIQILGRMDSATRSEQVIGELLRDLLATLTEDSSVMVDKMWRLLNELGMLVFASETALTYAEILAKSSHRYGDALWYFALARRVEKVRDILNLLMSYSLLRSAAYPVEDDLDQGLKNLLYKRTETLEQRAKQDLDAAQLLGRMLSGYATLRKFYELRERVNGEEKCRAKAMGLRRKAAQALVIVISSSADSIRGGIYDATREAVVSEDFLLALLGEATVFVNQSPIMVSLEEIGVLLRAIEDLETVGSTIYDVCDEFFALVLGSGQGLKGSTPLDLMTRSTNSLGSSSYIMSGSSMLASRLQEAIGPGGKIERGWDWRKRLTAKTKGAEVLRKMRLGLAKDLAGLWLDEADGVAIF